ncbi:hypothetical protein Acsp03_68910 [Actinomadura sp. NBRC 104412]|nr:hypothetical protein Acsp03_68910 [Actinomadura sp. NBRC 104412]
MTPCCSTPTASSNGDRDLDTGIQALVEAVRSCDHEDPEPLIDCVLDRLVSGTIEDDICILTARVL